MELARGRPTGTTDNDKDDSTKQTKNALTQLAVALNELQNNVRLERGERARVSNHHWIEACRRVALSCSVPVDALVSKRKTVTARVRRGNLPGIKTISPVAAMEPVLVEMIVMRHRMRQPLSKREAIQFAKS